MKRIQLLMTMFGLAAMALPAWGAEQTLSFSVEKMDCPVCPITVKKAMENVEGVAVVTVDFVLFFRPPRRVGTAPLLNLASSGAATKIDE